MEFLHLFALSVIQGLTEFLPVSSSGHLALMPKIFGEKDQGILIDVALHVGTLCAILVYYRRDIWQIGMGVLCFRDPARKSMRDLGFMIAVGSIPAVIAGLLIHEIFPDGIRDIRVITFNMIFFALLMGWADRVGAKEKTVAGDMTYKRALVIGLAQALALVPGVSRSGMTITAARGFGFNRVEAARFSFLLGIPAMAGAGLLSFIGIFKAGDAGLWRDAAIAIALAFVFGLTAIHFMMVWLRRAGLMPFVIYRLLLGIFLIFFFII